ncbi:thioredoxin-disulfide reductase [Stomatobaculum longum]|jgi:thioredoxin-disulfide reductase|uniref:thioredoxin-disulfide reductase n=1 Tax=Stomatobaculum longum TaxID=796942 RepID=UPI001CAC0F0B|nr:thioredoxin-disulfide reductase [Stomatobaculum longum]MBF1255994.1 thioredoxin-disulfide reductase [Stomatobaculum longum]
MSQIYDMIIIGSGPAGLAAAVYGQRAKLDLIVIEKQMISGGQIINTLEVDNYPGLPGIGGFELGQKFREHAEKLGTAFVTDEVKEVRINEDGTRTVVGAEADYTAKTVVIASGAEHSLLGVPGEKELTGSGVSYCATCDGNFYRNKVTAVVGGGDVALGDALYLARLCRKVYLIHRRDSFRGAKVLEDKVRAAENIELVLDSTVEEIRGEGQLKSILVKNKKSGAETELAIDGLFIAVGIVPESKSFPFLKTDERGYVLADETCETNVPGVYAAGDVRKKQLRQVITAVADGANAVESAVRYLTEQ